MGLLMGCTWHLASATAHQQTHYRKISDFPREIKYFGGFLGNVFAAEH
jgi:hypothetical protein